MVETKNDPNCVEPACASKMDFFKSSMGKKAKKAAAQPKAVDDCPLNREELGKSTWGLLHSMGIYYPDKPSPEYQAKARTFVEALALMYPCVHCADDFQKEIAKSPPRVESRTTFSMWLCEQHNIVNRKIHKPVFDCTMEKLEERWRKGKPSCWGEDGDEETAQENMG
ncbi:hypothetical protein BBO99_00000061 [Phytophthora kernoviae]|uniref:Sulfhydryl oxidase n=2 Tax=Phytophthora kernoviae TaxID=325452 RepID=A0A421F794_9STRA|nr:hypothetical protein G195_002081 [Phytophthora kernoviae 00238/432]KAG2533115.1 hypothetical protein JM16_000173 [Phytophthora kernoviae]KAG2533312.1 hypothetical protein JM18_000180 [Phytophthora kernoviae]RLN26854.1 hypothetical protein BBI17_000061 [Phytophthora kernoviae]RLN85941.1 hypothetical protein BBO99_00000061 [Phytophthora kernoviae]